LHYDIIAALLPTLAVLTGILLNRNDYAKLDSRLTSEISKLEARIGSEVNKLDARLTGIEGRLHSDMMLVIGKLTELDVRVARLEEKQAR
jgi:hypothetical protein